ncbi:hypothetical protein [Algibacter sp. L4_22]|uniref:hypothetical protein n=1 Tax=Algibacter sp. L4_22 TaxID=2942477 RepID=UPI00201B6B69|nr:hypothetical protein [Algibacter sp. L4_22]MCL5126777.1 hypothetical protein [Algibacter sp. L4_22]
MYKKITLAFALITYAFSFSQNANLDREYFEVAYVKLPSKPILEDSKRTYTSNKRAISISGFSRVKSNGTIDVNYTFNGTNIGNVDIIKTKHETKDKDGKVTSTSYTYAAHNTYSSSGSLSINNSVVLENSFEKTYSEKDDYVSSSFKSYKQAQDYYNNNRYNIKKTHSTKHQQNILSSINSSLNSTYGYVKSSTSNENFWILGTKKHPEYPKHMEAYETMKAAFSKMKYNESTADLKAELEPVIDYFNSLIPVYEGPKKKMKKMRYASYYNLAKIYYYLDMPEESKIFGQKLIDNDYDKSDGKNFIRISDNLLSKFKANETDNRHFEVVTEDLTNIEDEPEAEEESVSDNKLELVKAYLISKAGDTTLVDMETKDIKQIAYELRTVQYTTDGTPIGTEVKSAKGFNEVLFVDGTHYKNIAFKESSVKGDAVNAGQLLLGGSSEKLCKILYESEKLNLYLFNNEETVIFTPGSKKGKSTLSTGFVFGFKKNLIKLAEGCASLIEKAENKEFKNTPEDLIKFAKELASCE